MNWGKGITITIILFMGFIISFVVRAVNFDTDLVRTDYYEHELQYDSNIEKENNYIKLTNPVEIAKNESGIIILFPADQIKAEKGTINFYRPQSKKFDRKYDLALDTEGKQTLPYEDFFKGLYQVTIEWEKESKGFIFKQDITF